MLFMHNNRYLPLTGLLTLLQWTIQPAPVKFPKYFRNISRNVSWNISRQKISWNFTSLAASPLAGCYRLHPPVMLLSRPPSLNEREEHRLRHGKEYANLPPNYAELDPCYSIGKDRAPNIYASFHDCLGSYSASVRSVVQLFASLSERDVIRIDLFGE